MNMLKIDEVAARYRVSEITIHRWIKSGDFPRPLRIGRRCLRWLVSELDTFDATAAKPQPPRVESQLIATTI